MLKSPMRIRLGIAFGGSELRKLERKQMSFLEEGGQ